MIYEFGHILLIFVLFLSFSATLLFGMNIISYQNKNLLIIKKISIINFIFVFLSFLVLEYGFINSEFSLVLVANHSHTSKPLIYKISGMWGNHEGSMLLWILILTLFTFLLSISKNVPKKIFLSNILGIQNIIICSFLIFILFLSNPYQRSIDPPLEGLGLNPLLQDPGLAFHPPMLYLGYVGLSISFSFAVASLISKNLNQNWVNYLRPWTLLSWSFLSLGIALGSWWAYYELGWGGWWFWDPVENASLMPWLIATALIHSINVAEKKQNFMNWTILLAILGFSFSLLGTFIVRSGLITSVHAFASDPNRGIFILVILGLSSGIPLLIYGLKKNTKNNVQFFLMSRETALLLNNIFLVIATVTILIGTLYPLILELVNNSKISVGPAYYNRTFVPILIPFILIMAVAPFLSWGRWSKKIFFKKLIIFLCLTIIGTILFYFFKPSSIFALICASLSISVLMSVSLELFDKFKPNKINPVNFRKRIYSLPKSFFGMITAHLGLAVFLIGVTGEQFFKLDFEKKININDSFKLGQYEILFTKVDKITGPNYISESAEFNIFIDGAFIKKLNSEKRFYPVERNQTTEAGIVNSFFGDIYIVFGKGDKTTGWTIRAYLNPMVSWIWYGVSLMALGGLISIIGLKRKKKIEN